MPQPKSRSIDADLEVDAADPVERDGVALLGDQPRPLDEPPVGEGVGASVAHATNGRTTHQKITSAGQDPHDDVRDVGGAALAEPAARTPRRPATAPARAAGSSSAFGWVRVVTTTCSPSFSSLLEMATRRSCHPVAVARGRRRPRRPPWPRRPVATTSRPPSSTSTRPPGRASRPPGRSTRTSRPSVDARARRTPPAAPGVRARRRRPARRTRRSSAPSNASSRSVRSTSCPSTRERGGGRRPAARRRSCATLRPTPTTAAGPGRASRPARPGCRRPCGRRAARRWATSAGRRPSARQRRRRTASPVSSGSHGQRSAARRPGAAAPRTSAPTAAGVSQVRSSRPRPAVWCSATTTSPSRRAGPGALGDDGVGAGRRVDDLDGARPGRRRRRGASAVERWARGGGVGHGHYIGRRQPRPQEATRVSAAAQPGEGTDVPEDIDIHTTAGKLADLDRRLDEAVHAGSAKAVEKQHAKGRKTARERIELLFDEGSFVELDELARHRSTAFGLEKKRPVRRRRGHRLRHHRRPPGVRVLPGLHGLRRLAGRGLRREDHQGDGPRHQDRLPDHRHQRGRRRPDPGGRGLARPVRRDLPPQRARLRRDPADLADHGLLRRRARLLPRGHRLHDHGRRDLPHVHHRPRRDQDRHRRGRHDGGARRRPHPQHQVRQRPLHGLRRGRRDRVRQGAAVLPAAEQPRRAARRTTSEARPRGHRPRPRPRHADPGLPRTSPTTCTR